MTLKQYLNDWLADYSIQLALNTVRGYEVNIRHICKHIGNIELSELTYKDVQNCYTELLKTLSSTSVLYCHRVLRNALHRAEQLHLFLLLILLCSVSSRKKIAVDIAEKISDIIKKQAAE